MKNSFKILNPIDCSLQPTRIDIWQYPLHVEFPQAIGLLNQEELTRAQRYYFERHQRRFTVARAVMRLILARYSGMLARELTFSQNQYGKPILDNMPLLQFNLSHSQDMALLAIGSTYPLGIDLEFFAARPYEGIGNHMFSERENIALQNMPTALKPIVFFHIWAQKEALIKACGLGLSYPTQQFDVPATPSTNQSVFDSLHNQTWQMISFQPRVTCSAALCYNPRVVDIRYLAINDVCVLLGQGPTNKD